jgi:hypothetical protein
MKILYFFMFCLAFVGIMVKHLFKFIYMIGTEADDVVKNNDTYPLEKL